MLSARERRILDEIESQLAASAQRARQRVINALRAAAVTCAAAALATVTTLTASGVLMPVVGAPLIAVAGTITGSQLLSYCRRHALGPRLWWRVVHRPERSPGIGPTGRPAAG